MPLLPHGLINLAPSTEPDLGLPEHFPDLVMQEPSEVVTDLVTKVVQAMGPRVIVLVAMVIMGTGMPMGIQHLVRSPLHGLTRLVPCTVVPDFVLLEHLLDPGTQEPLVPVMDTVTMVTQAMDSKGTAHAETDRTGTPTLLSSIQNTKRVVRSILHNHTRLLLSTTGQDINLSDPFLDRVIQESLERGTDTTTMIMRDMGQQDMGHQDMEHQDMGHQDMAQKATGITDTLSPPSLGTDSGLPGCSRDPATRAPRMLDTRTVTQIMDRRRMANTGTAPTGTEAKVIENKDTVPVDTGPMATQTRVTARKVMVTMVMDVMATDRKSTDLMGTGSEDMTVMTPMATDIMVIATKRLFPKPDLRVVSRHLGAR